MKAVTPLLAILCFWLTTLPARAQPAGQLLELKVPPFVVQYDARDAGLAREIGYRLAGSWQGRSRGQGCPPSRGAKNKALAQTGDFRGGRRPRGPK